MAVDVTLGAHALTHLAERAGPVFVDETSDTLNWLVPRGAAEDWEVPGTYVLAGPVRLPLGARWLTPRDGSAVDVDGLHGALAIAVADLHAEVLLRRWEVRTYA